ncbi:MAG: hypothetical protein GX582_06955 [Acholeplasmataceae bacterium]|nr:hypothetical protein [Acholeplasmataceae bacterium]
MLLAFLEKPGLELSEDGWFENLQQLSLSLGFAAKPKDYRKNPEAYRGHVGDVAEMIRIAVSGRKNTPNFYYILKYMGMNKITERIQTIIGLL